MISKVSALEPKYGIYDNFYVETKYGISEPTLGGQISKIGKIAIDNI